MKRNCNIIDEHIKEVDNAFEFISYIFIAIIFFLMGFAAGYLYVIK